MRETKTKTSHRTLKNFLMAKRPRKENIMATINTTTANTARTSTKKHAFTFDHINKMIVGTDINFQNAGIPGSDLEAELNALMEARPSYSLCPTPTEKKPAKQTYKGLTKELMREYIKVRQDKAVDDLLAQFDNMIEEKKAFPTIKSWFLDYFKCGFTVEKAKSVIAHHKLNARKSKIRAVVRAKSVKVAPVEAEVPAVINF